MYDFDTVIDRLPTSSAKWSLRKELTGVEDVLPLWVADMDFTSPPEVVKAIKERAAHPLLPRIPMATTTGLSTG